MKKELTALILALAIVLSLAACVSTETANPRYTREPAHKIGVIVYNTGDNEVISFRDYLQGYIESNFEMVEFVYSESILNREQELEFIQRACDEALRRCCSSFSAGEMKPQTGIIPLSARSTASAMASSCASTGIRRVSRTGKRKGEPMSVRSPQALQRSAESRMGWRNPAMRAKRSGCSAFQTARAGLWRM
jgi:hypothetical protein